jgi:hypothetical protein
MDLPQFSESYSITAPLGSVSLAVDLSLEEISSQRVDLDTYKIDDDRSDAAIEFRRRLLGSLNEPAVVVAYRPFSLLSALCYPRADFVTYLGMFHERQATFEHKPWVESELRKLGVPVIPWRYFATEDRTQLEEYVAATGAVVLRTNRSDGGAGLCVIRDKRQVLDYMPRTADGFFAAAPFLDTSISLNINACIFQDGGISLHPPSLQLIGIEGLTRRQFGYCGNDFSAMKSISRVAVDQLEALTLRAGHWLYSQGYLGAFGLDALFDHNTILLAEINPRFQGSSLLSARLDKQLCRPDVFLCHLAAYLGRPSEAPIPLTDLVLQQAECSQIILHNSSGACLPSCRGPLHDEKFDFELSAAEGVSVLPNAVVLRAILRTSVLSDERTVQRTIITELEDSLSLSDQPSSRSNRPGSKVSKMSYVSGEE